MRHDPWYNVNITLSVRPRNRHHEPSGGTRRRRSGIWKPISGEEATMGRVTMLNTVISPVSVPNIEKRKGGRRNGNALGAFFDHDVVVDREL